ncbi:MAG: C_GCAxxG_C_C family protein [Clostridia bacterium]|nr:C_GCAxxG_C_C family protein [Clostridia bacterium]
MTDHAERAKALFLQGYNCAQSVFCAFTDITGLDLAASARLASSFGGGLARLREVCGAVSAAAMVLGMAKGYDRPGDRELKARHYALVRDFAERFRRETGSINCRALLIQAGVMAETGGEPDERTPEYYEKRPCPQLVWQAARILDEMLEEK